jgi:aspartyl-tRNA synthetase
MTDQMRTDMCGTLRAEDADRVVALCGWVDRRREHGEHLAFIDLRDHTGVVQCVVDGAHELRAEFVVRITGTVRMRPDNTENKELPTGAVELGDCQVEVLNQAEPPPFPLTDRTDTDETIRLRHRYVDLRRGRLQRNLRTRAVVNSAIRGAMERQGFLEVETPMLIASTPEGARDFVVPSRQRPGSFYALPQSPQLFKQLCMVGGVDRYYQIARCLRDEDLRADRQFEFMQLDLEASFVTEDEVRAMTTEAVLDATEAVSGARPADVPTITWLEAMERFGTDKPDTRFGLELIEVTEVFSATGFNAFQAPCVKAICVPGGASRSRKQLDELTDQAKAWGAKGLVWMKVGDDLTLTSPVAKFLSDDEMAALVASTEAGGGDLLLLVADERSTVREVLGRLRTDVGGPEADDASLQFLWVIDFPLFEAIRDGRPISSHHPFTMPHPEDLDLLAEAEGDELLAIRSQAYDLVLNGWELGSGSVRIHRSEIQSLVFERLGLDENEAAEKFGFLLDAFRFGAPPHAGFAVGIDRLVALLLDEDNIREVIAFPKTQSGGDPLTAAPGPIDEDHLEELGLLVRRTD